MTRRSRISVYVYRPASVNADLEVLRRLLALELSLPLSEVRFVRGRYGKPELDTRRPPSVRVEFNLSHCRDMSMIAVSRDTAVGVDVEAIRADRAYTPIIDYAFHRMEASELRRHPEGEIPTRFTAMWTRKEAVIKAIGGSAAVLLDTFRVPADLSRVRSYTEVPALDPESSSDVVRVEYADLPAGTRHRADVAWRTTGSPPLIEYRRLRPADLGVDYSTGRSYIR